MQTETTAWEHQGETRQTTEARIGFELCLRGVGRPTTVKVDAFRFWDSGERMSLSLYGPRGGYRAAAVFTLTEALRLQHHLEWLADYILPAGIEPTECFWGQAVRLEQEDRRRRWLIIQGARVELERAQLTAVDCHALACALRFTREHLEQTR